MQASNVKLNGRDTRRVQRESLDFESGLKISGRRIVLGRITVVFRVSFCHLMAEHGLDLGRSRWAPRDNKGDKFGTIRRGRITNTCFLRHS